MVPIAAALVTTKKDTHSELVSANYTAELDLNEAFVQRTGDEWNQVLNSATAEVLYGGELAPWTNNTHAFQPFRPQRIEGMTEFQVTAPSVAFAAALDCRILKPTDYRLQNDFLSSLRAQISINANDRRCGFNHSFILYTGRRTVQFQANRISNCEPDGSEYYYPSRLILLALTSINETHPQVESMNVLTCIPTCATTRGRLSVSWKNASRTSRPEFIDLIGTDPPSTGRPQSFDKFERGILSSSLPLESVANNAFAMLVLGSAVAMLQPASDAADHIRAAVADGDLIYRATVQAFSVVYRTAVSRIGFQPVAEGEQEVAARAILQTPEIRLWVRDWIAAVLLVSISLSTHYELSDN